MLMNLGLKDVQVYMTHNVKCEEYYRFNCLLLIHMQTLPPVKATCRSTTLTDHSTGLRTVSIGAYSYSITPDDLQKEQQAFEPGEGVSTC